MFKKLNKKGELTTQQIVLLIILIASFAVILFFILKLNLGQQTVQEICHNSVIMRGSSVVPTDAVPLKCKRQYVCLSLDGSCEKMTKPELIKVKTENEVYKVLTEEMAECWWMFGEGKINYVGSDTTPTLYCSICSQIVFDNSVKDLFNGANSFDKKKLYDYMANEKRSDGKTYLQYLFKVNNMDQIYLGNFGEVDFDMQHYSLVGIWSETSEWTWAGIGAVVFVAGAVTGGAGWIVGSLAFVAGGGAGYFIGPVVVGDSGNNYIPPSLIEVNSEEFYGLECNLITTAS
ncbi:hypothetical protein COU58_01840 [Candidatus Pacearchaeota archaeon CG10_big_fil_rev_8_21_14_0_10_32_42]|nr:MAG: hypothetical protein COU58_01840 [Candidatus Pacearchaeota archaeon CG10_big_fil_rev_8_21_14_0_10_32_42]